MEYATEIRVKEKTRFYGRVIGCDRCGQKRSLVRRYGLRLCRQCFRDCARTMGFKKYQ